MRFTRVEATAFGCHSGRVLELADGLNIIHGSNEAGKSTWLAALYAALCGIRRGKGQQKKEDRAFAERFKPWDPITEWKVSGRVVLDDGRVFDLDRDLEDGSDRVRDAATGSGIEGEIMFDGAPDGAHWLGLQRQAFRTVAFVDQASILSILAEAESLQDELQSAAQNARSGSTVAKAMHQLEAFRSEAVGMDKKGAVKPLKLALDRLAECSHRLSEEKERRAQWETLLQTLTQKQTEAAEVRRRLDRARAAIAWTEAVRLDKKANRAQQLHDSHPTAPSSMTAEMERLHAIDQALDAWEHCPAPVELTGPTAAEIRKKIEELPAIPAGDLEPHASVIAAFEDVTRERIHLEQLGSLPEIDEPANTTATPLELESTASNLEIEVPAVPAGSGPAIDDEETQPPTGRRRSVWRGVAGVAGLAVAAGMLLVGMQRLVPGAIFATAGLLALWLGLRNSASVRPGTYSRLNDEGERQGALDRARSELLAETVETARARCEELGVAPDPRTLRSMAVAIQRRMDQIRQYETWKHKHDAHQDALDGAVATLRDAIVARDARWTDDPDSAWEAYREACRRRSQLAELAGRKPSLEQQLSLQEEAERQTAEADRLRADAQERVLSIASKVGAATSNMEEAVARLRAVRDEIGNRLRQHGNAVHEWEELQALLDGGNLTDLLERAAAARRQADALVRAKGIDRSTVTPPSPEQIEHLEKSAERARTEAATLHGQLDAHGTQLHAPGELEEARVDAEAELARVRGLDETIEATLHFLRVTEEGIHQDIAPRLTDDLTGWLPSITAGRYTKAQVNPQSLAVRVLENATGEWREANALSFGTREQVYLLLRAALVGYMAPTERCPLLLDEVTAFCDTSREIRVLKTLLHLSHERQIILCTHDDSVVDWAQDQADEIRIISI